MAERVLPRPTVSPQLVYLNLREREIALDAKELKPQTRMGETDEFPIEIPWNSPLGAAIRHILEAD